MTGFGRTGKMFGFQHFDVQPDIVTFAKGISASWLPLSGIGCTAPSLSESLPAAATTSSLGVPPLDTVAGGEAEADAEAEAEASEVGEHTPA